MKPDFKKLLPVIVAIVAFAAISLIYFKPLLDGKKEIRQGDVNNYKGASKEISDYRKTHSDEPLWTNAMFGGMPAYQISAIYKGNVAEFIDKIFQLGLPHPAGMVFLYFIGFYILMLCLKVDPWIGIVGALAYGFSSYFFIIIEAGHNSKAHAIGYMAPLLGSIILTLRGNRIAGGALTALFTALELYTNHVQITYYLFLLVAVLMVVELVNAFRQQAIKGFINSCLVLAVAVLIGVLPNITNLWATYEYGKYSTRGRTELTIKANNQKNDDIKTSGLDKDYATQWSYGKSETFTLLIPNFKGGASEAIGKNKDALKNVDPQFKQDVAGFGAYFGDQPFTSGPVYVGAIMFFLALLGMFIIDSNIKWVLFIGTLLSITLAWGKNMMWLTNIFFDYFPAYNKFRAVSMILVIAELTIPLLAALALDKIYSSIKSGDQLVELKLLKKKVSAQKLLFISTGVVGGFALLCALAPTMFNSFQGENELQQIVQQVQQRNPDVSAAQIENSYAPLLEQAEIARKSIFTGDAFRTFIFILLAAAALWAYMTRKINKQLLAGIMVVFVLADMWPVAARYLNNENYIPKAQNEVPFAKSKADEIILADNSPDYRVLSLGNPFNDAGTSYYHKSVGGYHGAKLKRYQELIDFHIDSDITKLYQGLRSGGITDSVLQATFEKTKILNMLNTKYVIGTPDAAPLPNTKAYGNAWFVNEYKLAQNADEEIKGLGTIDPKTTAIIDQRYNNDLNGFIPKPDPAATIKLTSYEPNHLVYETKAASDQLAVFSEIYYPKGWNAYVDGNPAAHFNADYVLRAMRVPAGNHKIDFKFEPSVYFTGNKIAMVGSILLLLALGGAAFMEFRNRKKTA